MSSTATISTLSEFLLQARTQHMVFDLGRGIRKIDNQRFFEWENQQAPCPYPRQDHAWFCIVFWNEHSSTQRYIWFIKLPLDENGLLMSAGLQQFIDIVTQALGKQLQHTQDSQAQLPKNPYVFTPSQQQLALCNSLIRRELAHHAVAKPNVIGYLQAPNAIKDSRQWETLSLQDMADAVIHPHALLQSSEATQTLIANNINAYVAPVQSALLAGFECVEAGETLTQALIDFHQHCQTISDANVASLSLRAMSYRPHAKCVRYISHLISSANTEDLPSAHKVHTNTRTSTVNSLDIETCVVIAGRYWQILKDKKLLAKFMHQVALADSSFQLFQGLYSDLVKIPETRNTLLGFIRTPERSNEVSMAIGALFASAKI
jgi:hypothetical protein